MENLIFIEKSIMDTLKMCPKYFICLLSSEELCSDDDILPKL